MVQVDHISKSYGTRVLFSDVTFHIGKKERCALAGRNGSGKSTLINILLGREGVDSGAISFPKGLRVGGLPQHLRFTQPTLVKEAILGLPPQERDLQYKVEILLEGLGFSDEDFEKSPQSFSGGYQLRIALCKVLAGEPDLLLLDEPTNYLDIVAIKWLESFLKNWPAQIMFISHDREFVNSIATHVLGIKRGKIKKVHGNLEEYETMIAIQEETHEKRRVNIEKKKKHMMSFVERFGAKATKAAQAQSRLKAIEKMDQLEELQQEQNLCFQFNYKRIQSKRILSVKDLHFSYDKQKPLIKNVKFELASGERMAFIGKNGSGKSTLLKLVSEEFKADRGEVIYAESAEIGYFGQTNIDRLSEKNTIEEELIQAFPDAPYEQVCSVCGAMLFSGDDRKKSISVLSGGERSRVLLAKILLTPANLLLLDEPTHHLDVESIDALMNAINNFLGSVILVTHDESVLRKLQPKKMIVCHMDRQELFLGNYDEFLNQEGWGNIQGW